MPRPILHSLTFLLILGLLIPAAGCRLEQAAVCQGCNVVLVSMDTLRADHTGAYGYGLPTTPQLDLFAQEAVLFEDAVSQSAWTRPAHTSMFTGLYPAEHGVISMGGNAKVPGDLPTLAERMREGGYATAAFTGGANMSARFGFDRGFDLYKSPGLGGFAARRQTVLSLRARFRAPPSLSLRSPGPARPWPGLAPAQGLGFSL